MKGERQRGRMKNNQEDLSGPSPAIHRGQSRNRIARATLNHAASIYCAAQSRAYLYGALARPCHARADAISNGAGEDELAANIYCSSAISRWVGDEMGDYVHAVRIYFMRVNLGHGKYADEA